MSELIKEEYENYEINTKQDIADMAYALSKAFQDEEFVKENSRLFKLFCDGEPKNINPLTEIPKSQMKLYGFSNGFISNYFDTEEELENWMKNNDTSFGTKCIIEYIGNVAERSDVIKVTNERNKSKLYTAADEDGYGIYNNERSIYCGQFIWEYNHGSIKEMYTAFKERGIIFENDVYGKIDKRNQQILKYCKENNLFNMGKK